MTRERILPAGWEISEPFDSNSAIVSVAAGAGVNATVPQLLTSLVIPPAARVYIERIYFRNVDNAQYDQLRFALRHKGYAIPPWDRISGEQIFDAEHYIEVGRTFEGGLLEIVSTNISGTAETGAGESTAIRVIARWYGYLLRRNS